MGWWPGVYAGTEASFVGAHYSRYLCTLVRDSFVSLFSFHASTDHLHPACPILYGNEIGGRSYTSSSACERTTLHLRRIPPVNYAKIATPVEVAEV